MKTTMKMLLVAGIVALAAAGGWFAAKHRFARDTTAKSSGARKILFYQSAMHPWIKSDKPGKCTICGMDLVPVYEGDKGFDAAPGLVTLNSNSISVIGVQTAEVSRAPLRRTLRLAGTIDDNDAAHRRLSAYVEGRIEKLFVNFTGAEVTAGQPLAVLYSPTLFAAEREYLSLLQQSREAGAVFGKETEHLVEAAAFKLRRFGLSTAQIAALPRKAETDYRTEILAPITGTVVIREIYEGQYVKEGDKLFELADFSTMWFKADLYERDFAWVMPGQRVEITTPALPGQVLTGAVTFIDPNLNEMTRSAKVRVELPNPLVEESGTKRRLLRHRLYAEASVNVDLPETLTVPRAAVLSPGGEPVVYVDKGGGAYEQRRVKLGRAGDALWEVLAGLNTGERVVTQGNLMIDAQAQLNSSAQGNQEDTAPPVNNGGADLPANKRAAIQSFLSFADALGAALATDDVKQFNAEAVKSHAVLEKLADELGTFKEWKSILSRVHATGHITAATDLPQARKAFLPFSAAAVELARQFRALPGATGAVKIYQCSMTKEVFEGAPTKAVWLQIREPKQNPYMGRAMPDCGTEVK